MQWIEKTVAVKDLKPHERNPRTISKDAFERLKRDIQANGYHQRIIATHDLRVIGGHQRQKALLELGITEIPVLVPSEPISDERFREMIVKDNLQFGEFDFNILAADYELAELVDYGLPEHLLSGYEGNTPDSSTKEVNPDDFELEKKCPRCGFEFNEK